MFDFGTECRRRQTSFGLKPHAPALPFLLALGLALGQAGTGPLALLHGRGELGHPVQRRPVLGATDADMTVPARPSARSMARTPSVPNRRSTAAPNRSSSAATGVSACTARHAAPRTCDRPLPQPRANA